MGMKCTLTSLWPPSDELPSDACSANAEIVIEGGEDILADVDVVDGAAHALVLDRGFNGATVRRKTNRTATERVAVGLGAHLDVGQGSNAAFARVVIPTSTEACSKVGEVSVEGARAGVLTRLEESELVGVRGFANTRTQAVRTVSIDRKTGQIREGKWQSLHVAGRRKTANGEDMVLRALVGLGNATANVSRGGPHELGFWHIAS